MDRARTVGFVGAASALLDAGADPNTGWTEERHQPRPEWESAIYGAAGVAHHPELTGLLLARGADPNDEETPYHVPETYDNAALEVLLASGPEVDAPGVRIGVKQGSAYDLYLTRMLQQATVVRGAEGVDVFLDEGLEVAAGIRQPITRYVAEHPELRLIDERFMQIQQAVGTAKSKHPDTVAYLHDLIEDLKSSGFIAASLAASGQADATVAPPA